jgi:putative heme-binding domain-containing protein
MDVQSGRSRMLLVWAILTCVSGTCAGAENTSAADIGEAQWIWSPVYPKDHVNAGACFFRKSFDVSQSDSALVQITCDDRYELYVNGRRAGSGNNWKVLQNFDVQKLLQRGRNCIAVKAENSAGSTAGLVARVTVKHRGGTEVSYSTDATWKTSLQEASGWEKPNFNDARWTNARSWGEFGSTPPWGDLVATSDGSQSKRFSVTRDFRVERVIGPDACGSLIAMAFNEWGEILASREKGPLLLVIDKNHDGIPETVTTYCEEVTSAQGILALNGDVYAIGEGPDGAALYHLVDSDRNGKADKVTAIMQFDRPMGEHGPHAITLGPDGFLYLMIGNHAAVKKPYDTASPVRHYYEGDLLVPKYEDANGHAVGIKAPGGTVIRTDTEGSLTQLYGAGFRNAYDLTFNRFGDLFTYDSDMEWDIGLPWYRPTRVNQVVSGAEFGWRSGWSPWPPYYLDSLPPTVETDRGSPTGIEIYDHYMYPRAYHDAIFAGDWSQGRILAIHLKPSGAGYEARSEVFLQGRPLNVTDLAVGPDGWLYFSTGGRGTEGGIYRVVWTGKVTPPVTNNLVLKAIRQPQPLSAWGRQRIATIQEKVGAEWGRQLIAVAEDTNARLEDRTRALDLIQLYGPMASPRSLMRLAEDGQPEVRAKAAFLLGLQPDEAAGPTLAGRLKDPEARVRRVACEAISRGGYKVEASMLIGELADPDRFVAYAARQALETMPPEKWQDDVLQSSSVRTFLVGAVGLLARGPDAETAQSIVARGRKFLSGYLSDDDFVDLMRVFELALVRGKLKPDDVPELRRELAQEYPAGEWRMNRELVLLLAYLQDASILPRLLDELKGSAPDAEKIHAALHARFITSGWTSEQKYALLEFYEQARGLDGGHSFVGYIDNVSRDFCASFNETERQHVLAHGKQWPGGALSVLVNLSMPPKPEIVAQLIDLDTELKAMDAPAAARLRTGIVAVLGSSGDSASMAHLRASFEKEPDRRSEIAMGLAQVPGGANWPLLIRALPVLDGLSAQEVLAQLATTEQRPDKPEPIRQVILCGLKLGADGQKAVQVLEKWTDKTVSEKGLSPEEQLAAWQKWFSKQYPDAPPAVLPVQAEGGKWDYQELLEFLATEGSHGQPRRGAQAFEKAQCAKCHRFNGRGEGIGPDLSTISQRFQRKEILESILFPSHVISDQFASKVVVTNSGKTYTGIVGGGGTETVVVLQSNGEKVTIRKQDIEETMPSKKSAMPEGLLNVLTQEEIADLFAYLTSGGTLSTARK